VPCPVRGPRCSPVCFDLFPPNHASEKQTSEVSNDISLHFPFFELVCLRYSSSPLRKSSPGVISRHLFFLFFQLPRLFSLMDNLVSFCFFFFCSSALRAPLTATIFPFPGQSKAYLPQGLIGPSRESPCSLLFHSLCGLTFCV